MIWIAGLIFVLVALVISSNVRYAVREYLGSSRRVMFSIYLVVLLAFGVITIRTTLRLLDLFEEAKLNDGNPVQYIHE